MSPWAYLIVEPMVWRTGGGLVLLPVLPPRLRVKVEPRGEPSTWKGPNGESTRDPRGHLLTFRCNSFSTGFLVTHIVSGVLQLHGKRRPVNFPATIEAGAAAVTVSASFDINRQNWGVSYPGKKDDLIKDDVKIKLDLNFPVGDASSKPE